LISLCSVWPAHGVNNFCASISAYCVENSKHSQLSYDRNISGVALDNVYWGAVC
jgi:hypothetical protein